MFQLLAVGTLALIASTWPLWTPQTAFPEVPLLRVAGRLHAVVDWLLLFALLTTQVCLLFARREHNKRVATSITAGCLIGLICIDQHRLQPWAWQFILISLVLTVADGWTAQKAWRWIIIGIYIWSAWSKFDYGFTRQHGPFLLDGLLKSVGLKGGIQSWSTANRAFASIAIPCAEFLIAIGLAWPRTRRVAVFAAATMHLTLLMALGPWGHNHQPGVLLWNVFFLMQNALLFRHYSAVKLANVTDVTGSPSRGTTIAGNRFAWGVVATAMLWPATESIGFCDHWPAWAVYAAKPERVTVSIDSNEQVLLSTNMERYIGNEIASDGWVPVRLDRWSLDAVRCPIYPQDRFQVGVALGLAAEFHLSTLRITIEGPADRWSGKRSTKVYEGLDSIRTLANSFRLGACPRPRFD